MLDRVIERVFFDVQYLAREHRSTRDQYVISEVMDNIIFICAISYVALKTYKKVEMVAKIHAVTSAKIVIASIVRSV